MMFYQQVTIPVKWWFETNQTHIFFIHKRQISRSPDIDSLHSSPFEILLNNLDKGFHPQMIHLAHKDYYSLNILEKNVQSLHFLALP
jgi:hypothetical protein